MSADGGACQQGEGLLAIALLTGEHQNHFLIPLPQCLAVSHGNGRATVEVKGAVQGDGGREQGHTTRGLQGHHHVRTVAALQVSRATGFYVGGHGDETYIHFPKLYFHLMVIDLQSIYP